ncbi:branched-chain amino acid ABC transporter permease protein (plasmid) [Rhizobium gallicum]|uniref:Branched-chain amino acid ABC transporter permease protein n=1 Tax=Rhizobium gallicum TaxID=56730 RepID=A0A1L5NS36_9HYPH|nr:branched-chain amino acid ABC transporter permease [Rhizobium gallicum]APO70711.1 branched-chain amino acid ABC transporter permease protein [Rhizobium gallicum]
MLYEYALIILRGLGLGAVFSLIAISLNVVQISSRIINFAQGHLFVFGGLFAFLLLPSAATPWEWLLWLPVATLVVAAILVVQGAITLVPLGYANQQFSWLITTMAASVIFGAIILLSQGPFARVVRSPFANPIILGVPTPMPYVMAVFAAVLWYIALRWIFSRTVTGLAIAALAQDYDAARAAGLNIRKLQLIAFGISGLIIGSTGYIAAPITPISADVGLSYMINGFTTAVIGGIGSNVGALIAGPVVGIIMMYATFTFGGELQGFISMMLLVIVLMLRPEGLFGRTTARRV